MASQRFINLSRSIIKIIKTLNVEKTLSATRSISSCLAFSRLESSQYLFRTSSPLDHHRTNPYYTCAVQKPSLPALYRSHTPHPRGLVSRSCYPPAGSICRQWCTDCAVVYIAYPWRNMQHCHRPSWRPRGSAVLIWGRHSASGGE